MTQAYEAEQFDPPAPVAYVTVKTSGVEIRTVPMLIDTGADVSLLPRSQFESLIQPVLDMTAKYFQSTRIPGSALIWTG